MNTTGSSAALDRVTPARLWIWAVLIASLGVALRALWFWQFEHELPFGFGSTLSGHAWALESHLRIPLADVAVNSYDITRAFAPGYGAMLHGLVALAGGAAAGDHTVAIELLVLQSACVAIATLLTFALARRVLFGYVALLPPLLLTASIALIELPGGLAPGIPLMLLVILAVWQITLLRERLPARRGPAAVALTISAGFTLGAAILFNPAALLLAPLILWWAFRGLGAEHATLLLVAVVLLPASWLAVAQTAVPGGIPTDQARAWAQQDAGHIPNTFSQAADRAYAFATPWNARFARGAYASRNWNYEWVLPRTLRADSTYLSVTRALAGAWMIALALLVLLGLVALFAEGAGSGARLLALPVIALPLATFMSTAGNLLRIPLLPFLAIALTLGLVWVAESLRRPFAA